jgi:hypothetical protein
MEERLPALENPMAEEIRSFVEQEQPFVMRGICRDWPALRKWDFAYLTHKLKQTPGEVYKATFRTRVGELQEDVPTHPALMRVVEHEGNFKLADNMALWLSPASNVTTLHYDGYGFDGLNVQVTGYKVFELFHPDLRSKMAPFVQGAVSARGDDEARRRVTSYRVELAPGDCLFTPRFWYHTVTARTDATNVQYHFSRRALPRVESRAMRHYVNNAWVVAHAPWLIPSGVRRGIAEYPEIIGRYAERARPREALLQATRALATMAALVVTQPRQTARSVRYFNRKTVEDLSKLM